jgi:hypothetical protein
MKPCFQWPRIWKKRLNEDKHRDFIAGAMGFSFLWQTEGDQKID